MVKQLKMKGLITAFQSGAEFAQLIKPIGQRPLILSGHPGDEVMALGGTMSWYAKHKIPMTVLTFTAGMRGTNTGRLSKALGPKRRKEQIAGFEAIGGAIHPLWLDLPEKFVLDQDLVLSLVDRVDELNPDIIYVPSFLDNHPDSQVIAQALVQVLERLPSTRLKHMWVAQYELWTPIVPNKILNCDDFVARKQKAIECHESQLLCRDYLGAMLGLNRYRAAMLGAGSSAEAYFLCSAPQYLRLLEQKTVEVFHQVD